MKYSREVLLLSVILATTAVSARNMLKCMACEKATHLANCEEVEICDPDLQVCYVEEVTDIGGEIVINAGCRYKEQCDFIGCFGEGLRKRRSIFGRYDHLKANFGDPGMNVSCHHCCAGDFCNIYGCPDTFSVNQLLGSRCFSCERVNRPEDCNTVVNCHEGYVCGQESVALGTETLYNLGCMNKRKCDILRMLHSNSSNRRKRNFIPLWAECCDSHLCNGYIPMLKESPQSNSPDYVCPRRFGRRTTGTTTTVLPIE